MTVAWFPAAVRSVAARMKRARVLTYAAAAVYHMFIALSPLLMLILSLIRFLPITQEDVMKVFSGTLPEQAFSFINSITTSIFNSSRAAAGRRAAREKPGWIFPGRQEQSRVPANI